MTDQELNEIIGVYERMAAGAEPGAMGSYSWPRGHVIFRDIRDGLLELRNWRLLRPLVQQLCGELAGGADPDLSLDDLVGMGLVLKVPFDPAVHQDPHEVGFEAGDDHYVIAPAVEALLK